jgi:large subunit ribosomal protein L3
MVQGIIGKKLGMTQLYDEKGRLEAVTAIEAGPCTVLQVKTPEKEGYNAIQFGFGASKRATKAEKGQMRGFGEFNVLREVRTEGDEPMKVGDKVDVNLFKVGDKVDVTGIAKSKGFAGVVKRHHFKGGPKTHGQSDRTRHPGAIGSTTYPGHVWKNVRMAGRMGGKQFTILGLEVLKADAEKNLLFVKGAVPGGDNGVVIVKKSIKG